MYDKTMAKYEPKCFETRILTPKDVEYLETVAAHGSLNMAIQRATDAPDWELFEAWEVDEEVLKAAEERIRQEQVAAHTLGQSLLSKPDHEHADGEEMVNRFGFKRAHISFKSRRTRIISSRDQKLIAEHIKKHEAEKKRLDSLERAEAARLLRKGKLEERKKELAEQKNREKQEKLMAKVKEMEAKVVAAKDALDSAKTTGKGIAGRERTWRNATEKLRAAEEAIGTKDAADSDISDIDEESEEENENALSTRSGIHELLDLTSVPAGGGGAAGAGAGGTDVCIAGASAGAVGTGAGGTDVCAAGASAGAVGTGLGAEVCAAGAGAVGAEVGTGMPSGVGYDDDDDDGCWAASVTVIDMNASEGKEDVLEYYKSATLTAIEINDQVWASVLSEQVESEMVKTNDTKHRNKLRKVAETLTGIL